MTFPPASQRRAHPPFTPSPGEPLPHQIVAALAQHRLATTAQLRVLLRPAADRRVISQPLNRLRREAIVDFTVLPQSHRTRAWFLTSEGVRVTRDWPHLRGHPAHPVTSAPAASLRAPHTLTVLRSHLTFITDARRRGDEHGHLDWTPEVAHSLGEGERVIADALLHYVLCTPDGSRVKLRALVEVDRATSSSERLATKLISYARLHTYTPTAPGRHSLQAGPPPVWRRWYPVFPRVLFILTGAGSRTLSHRIQDLQAMACEHPAVSDLARSVPLGAAVLEDLEAEGPTAAVWTPLTGHSAERSWTEL